MTLPVPPHASQERWDCIMPRMVRCCTRMVPVPPQRLQVSGLVPFSAPVPPQALQASVRGKVMVFLQPKTASSKEMDRRVITSSPRTGPFRRAALPPPPKKVEKMSPISKFMPPL